MTELHQLSEFCGFKGLLDDMLRDRLVCGIRDAKVQRQLLAEPDLKFKKALELSQAAEAAERDTEELQGNQASNMHVLVNTKGKT